MNRILKGMLAVALVLIVMTAIFTGCSAGKPTVNLNDYVKVICDGYDGYGSLTARVDFKQIVEDYGEYIEFNGEPYFKDKTPEAAVLFTFEYYEPYKVGYEKFNSLKNGDKVKFSWELNENGIEHLATMFNVDFTYKDFDYEVKDLQPLKEVDPFETIDLEYFGSTGRAVPSPYGKTIVNVDDKKIELALNFAENYQNVSNGDVLKVSVEADDASFAKSHGIVFTRKEAEIVVEGLNYYAQEDPYEVFEYITPESIDKAITAIKSNYEKVPGVVMVEYVGAMYYYADTLDFESHAQNANNQLVLVFHIENGIVPGGWYSYLAPLNDVIIKQVKHEDGSVSKHTILEGFEYEHDTLLDTIGNYRAEYVFTYGGPEYTTDFNFNGKYYAGHMSLEDMMEAFEVNVLNEKNLFGDKMEKRYNCVIATEALQEFIK